MQSYTGSVITFYHGDSKFVFSLKVYQFFSLTKFKSVYNCKSSKCINLFSCCWSKNSYGVGKNMPHILECVYMSMNKEETASKDIQLKGF